jgi:plastocyanin
VYQWLVFVHLIGVFAFLVAHGTSVGVLFRLRNERDPARVHALLQLSSSSIQLFYWSLGLLVAAGVVAAFDGHLWKTGGWLYAALVVLVLTSVAMVRMAKPYYARVRFISQAMAGGSKAVTEDQLVEVLRSRRPLTIAAIGVVGLGAILYFMVQKPTFGLGSASAPPSAPGAVSVVAKGIAFDTSSLSAPAGKGFTISFDNQDAGVPHNVAIYTTSAATTTLFRGTIVTGPKTITYHVPALQPGSYFFRCDVHPQMRGTLVARGS